MGPDQPSRFRSANPLGANGVNDLSFNELGGSRVPGPTGTKSPPSPGPLPAPKLLAVNNAGTSEAALPPTGPAIPTTTSVGASASPNAFHSSLSSTERGILWAGILAGDSFEDTHLSLNILRGTGNALSLKLTSKLSNSTEENPRLRLVDQSLLDPQDVEFTNEAKALHREYINLTLHEYWELKETVKSNFHNGWSGYHDLRHLYLKAGYSHPPSELNKIKADVTFLKCKIVGGVHPELEEILKSAESKLTGTGPLAMNEPREFHLVGFVPRAISDDKKHLSNHALGKAVDIDADENPQFSSSEALALDKVLAWLKSKKREGVWWLQSYHLSGPYPFSQSLTAASMPDGSTAAYREMQQNSLWIQAFLREMNPMRHQLKLDADQARKYLKSIHRQEKKGHAVPEQPADRPVKDAIELSENLEHLIAALGKATPPVKPDQAIKHGILSIPPQIFMAMAEAGARSGLDPDYQHKKDSMHFEVFRKRAEMKKAKGAK